MFRNTSTIIVPLENYIIGQLRATGPLGSQISYISGTGHFNFTLISTGNESNSFGVYIYLGHSGAYLGLGNCT